MGKWIIIFVLMVFFFAGNVLPDSKIEFQNGEIGLLQPLTNDLKINDDTSTRSQYDPAIALNKYGCAVVCWTDTRDGQPRIWAQLFGDKGFAKKRNFAVSEISGEIDQIQSAVAINDLGHFVVVWADNHSGNYDIYARLFAANGDPVGDYFQVNDDETTENQTGPEIAMTGNGNFVICWMDYRDEHSYIYAQRYRANGTPSGENFRVNDLTNYSKSRPDVDLNEAGEFVIVWQDAQNALVNYIYGQRYNSDGSTNGDIFQVSLDPWGERQHYYPSIALQDDGSFMVAYQIVGVKEVLYAGVFDRDATPLLDNFQIPEVAAGTVSNNSRPCVAANLNGGFTVVWQSDFGGTLDIFGRNFNHEGAPLGSSVRLNDVPADQGNPCIAIDSRGIGLIAWVDTRNSNNDIYGFGLGPIAPLNPTAGSGFPGFVPLSWDHIYAYANIDQYNIYRSTTSGGPYSRVTTVDLSARGPLGRQMRDWIDTDVVDGTTYYYTIKALVSGVESQRSVEVSATPATAGFHINSSWSNTTPIIDGEITEAEWAEATKINIASPTAPLPITLFVKNNAEQLFLAIEDSNDYSVELLNILGIIFDEDANGLWDAGSPGSEGLIAINMTSALFTGYWGTYPDALGVDAPIAAPGTFKAVSAATGHVKYEVSFDLRTSPLNAAPGETIGIAFLLDDPSNYYPYHYGYAAEWPRGTLWECAQPLGRLTLDRSTSASDKTALPKKFHLAQNYPNPFNPATTIEYQLGVTSDVSITIFDARGSQVRELAHGKQTAGLHQVRWDGRNDVGMPVASGVYFYRIKSQEFQEIKKCLLMK